MLPFLRALDETMGEIELASVGLATYLYLRIKENSFESIPIDMDAWGAALRLPSDVIEDLFSEISELFHHDEKGITAKALSATERPSQSAKAVIGRKQGLRTELTTKDIAEHLRSCFDISLAYGRKIAKHLAEHYDLIEMFELISFVAQSGGNAGAFFKDNLVQMWRRAKETGKLPSYLSAKDPSHRAGQSASDTLIDLSNRNTL